MKLLLIIILLLGSISLPAQNLTLKDSIDLYNGNSIDRDSQTIQLEVPNYKRALVLSKMTEYKLGEFDALIALGDQDIDEGHPEDAFKKYQQAYALAEEINDLVKKAKAKESMGHIQMSLENYDLAINYYREAKKTYEQQGDTLNPGLVLCNMGAAFLRLEKGDTAMFCLSQALEILEKCDHQKGVVYVLNNMGIYYMENEQPERALSYFNQILEKDILDTDFIMKGSTYMNIGSSFLHLKDYNNAETYYYKALDIHKKNNFRSKEFIVYSALAYLYQEIGDFEQAFEYQEKHYLLKDSITGVESQEKIAGLELQFEVVSKEKELLESRSEILLLEKEKRTTRMRYGIGLGILGIGIMVLFFRNRVTQLRKIEEIRTKIARNLHDDVSNTLNNISIISAILKNKNLSAQELDEEVTRISRLSKEAVTNISDVIWTVNTDREKMDDLITRLEDLAEDYFRPLGVPVKMEIGEFQMNKKLSIQIRQNILLIFKEALNNISKHSQPTFVNIKLYNEEDQFKMSIQNDNALTSNEVDAKSSNIGLTSMRYRAKQIDGTVDTQLEEDQFTLILRAKQFA